MTERIESDKIKSQKAIERKLRNKINYEQSSHKC